MYKLIIIDDEMPIRNGLERSIDWNASGFSIAGVFSCGNDAIRFLKDNVVDAVLTDIRMHDGSGLEVAEWIGQNRRGVQVVLITGYSDYEAACRAIACGSVKYILQKPLPLMDVKRVCSEVARSLDEHHAVLRRQTDVRLACIQQILSAPTDAEKLWSGMTVMTLTLKEKPEKAPALRSLRYARRFYGLLEKFGYFWIAFYPCAPEEAEEISELAQMQVFGAKEVHMFSEPQSFQAWLSEQTPVYSATEKDHYLATVDRYLADHLQEKILLKDVAHHLHYSTSYFCRIFPGWSGMGFSDYLTQYRIEHAKKLLNEPNLSIARIANAVGFEDTYRFTQTFKKKVGVLPSAYRRSML